jgi:beta-phosphoglucomutase
MPTPSGSTPAPPGLARGFIFDLDGTIVDNMPIHAEAFGIFVTRHGLSPLTPEDRRRLDGRRNREIFPDLFGRTLSEDELRLFAGEKESLYRELSVGRLVPLRGFEQLLSMLESRRIPAAIATSAPPENVTHTLRELRLSSRLTRITRGDQVRRGKPYPDVFLASAALMGVPPECCVAFEDAPAGITAVKAAGMTAVAITTSFSRDVFRSYEPWPDVIVADFEEFVGGPGGQLIG